MRGAGGRVRGRKPQRPQRRKGGEGGGDIGAAAPRGPERNLITIHVRHGKVRVELGQRGWCLSG